MTLVEAFKAADELAGASGDNVARYVQQIDTGELAQFDRHDGKWTVTVTKPSA